MSFLFHEQSSDNFFALLGIETGLRLLAWFSAFSQSPIRPALCVTRNKKSHAQSLIPSISTFIVSRTSVSRLLRNLV